VIPVAAVLPSGWGRAAIWAYAVPGHQKPPGACPVCDARLTWAAFGPSARCGSCAARIGAPPYAVEIAMLTAAVVLIAWHRPLLDLPAYLWWAGFGVVLSFVDVRVRRLPNTLTAACAAGLMVGLAVPAFVDARGGAWLRALLAGLAVAGALGALALIRPNAMGWGDAKAGYAVGAALGWISWFAVYAGIFLALLLACGYAVAQLARGRIRRRDALPLGPFLFAGAMLAVLLLS
jgi:leader peptidase (prepilin peptidase)/N-methyltransferase